MKRHIVTAAVLAVLAAACGDAGTPATTAPVATTTAGTTPAAATTVPTTTTLPPGPQAVDTLQDVRGAVVRIVAKGTFVDPSGTQANVPGTGSGFIIRDDGIAVTNNHVVTGAALLEVFVEGEDAPRNARVLGVSECSDLAVIDIDGGPYPFLEWFDGEVAAGLEIFAAGYPLGDAEYTVLDGIVSKEAADGESSWASVDAVIEHSADTLPGNSGGPIVTADGKVVAVNYAGNDLGQAFGIGLDVARPIVDALSAGTDVGSIGVNGEALADSGFAGIWVYSVESGSPADNAGVQAGDLLITMEDLSLGLDGTMAEYCDIVRSHSRDDVLDIEVYRAADDAVLAGQLNGRVLETITSFAAELDDEVADDVGGFTYTDYAFITDDSDLIEVSVPVAWSDTLGEAWQFRGEAIGPALSAAPDRQAWLAGWATPGVFIGATTELSGSVTELLDEEDFSGACAYGGRFDYDDGLYVGLFDVWEDCGDEGSTFIVVVAEPADRSFVVLVQLIAVTDADLDAADEVFNTFRIVGDLAS